MIAVHQIPDTRYQVPENRTLVLYDKSAAFRISGTGYLVSGTWYLHSLLDLVNISGAASLRAMRSRPFLLCALALIACDAPPVDWGDPISISGPADGRLTIDSAGHAELLRDSLTEPTPSFPGVCPGSVRAVQGPTQLRAIWWGLRPDSGAVLYMAASTDSGKTWSNPVKVDTADTGVHACQRPAPTIASVGDDLHIAYSMTAKEGTGVFFAHFLSSMVHSPVAVIYGDRVVPTAIAAEGTRIAVAYEQPNGTRHQIGLALSSSQGHIFESHMTASRDIDDAVSPKVAMTGNAIAVSWLTPKAGDTTTTRVVRVGHIR